MAVNTFAAGITRIGPAGNKGYLSRIESSSPRVRALGVTDYFCIRTYREVRRRKSEGRLPDVDFLFPNVEMRLDVETPKKKAINLHLLFSPDDDDHEAQIVRALGHFTFEYRAGRTDAPKRNLRNSVEPSTQTRRTNLVL